MATNALWYGDNLDILRDRIATESVDLIYLDPPFNSNRSYNVLFGNTHGEDARAQIEAFDDTWTWAPETEQLYIEMLSGAAPARVADALQAMHNLVGEGELMAYLVMMAARLVELHRVLKPTGSIYLHCDPTASHYLKVLLDAVFGPRNFRTEIVWKRSSAHSDTKQGRAQHGRIHDVILFYSKSDRWIWNPIHTAYTDAYVEERFVHREPNGRRYKDADLTAAKPGGDTSFEWRIKALEGTTTWTGDPEGEWQTPKPGWVYRGVPPSSGRYWAYSRDNFLSFHTEDLLYYTAKGTPRLKQYADELDGVSPQDLWTDIPPINSQAKERLGYPTQKPQALLERIIAASSNEGDLVLDPFCGCGTTIAAAQALGRRWVGIDVTFIAIDLVRRRMEDAYGEKLDYELHGIPRDLGGAKALFRESPFDFERWAVSMVNGQPNEKQVGDKGIDGVIRFPLDAKVSVGRCIVSVKGGGQVNPAMVRDLGGTITNHKAEMGVLITMDRATPGMIDAANHGGSYTWPVNEATFPRVQLITVAQLLKGEQPNLPPALTPYLKASRHTVKPDQLALE